MTSTGTWQVDSDGGNTDGDTGPGDLPGCDPLQDPQYECGAQQECDPGTLTCVPAPGSGLVDDPCTLETDCAPGLVCTRGYCAALCDANLIDPLPDTVGACPQGQLCAQAGAPLPGLCRQACLLVDQACATLGFACNRIQTKTGTQAACTPNPGTGLVGDICFIDEDCSAGRLCSPALDHTLPCVGEAAACCAEICDPLLLPCFGAEPLCYALLIPDQPDAGYCGRDN